ncbi:histidine phosphatase family protein [Saccharibacillus sp. CPCC 101409]|uniref:histidine phosphatase family protein n=1 Tax=Saccharibacillus sp. CPCC 101409 TaxID=3058041 RepID=UPI002672D5FD|nr:histidine phosphatase family protein [Saccharibacillus sp. CPCC 101409]MDO3410544.1 histidine phosphatase family protein [Saccharibacillus sp. CPCC 101409]
MTQTILYFVRHAESFYAEGRERERGLSEQGTRDAQAAAELLRPERIDAFVSSPYERAVATIRPAAEEQGREIRLEEDLRERKIGDFAPYSFADAKRRALEEPAFSFPGGESGEAAQARAMAVVRRIVKEYAGRKIALGTHGDIMTLMLNGFDSRFGYEFWTSTTMPDIYRMTLDGEKAVEVRRLWTT